MNKILLFTIISIFIACSSPADKPTNDSTDNKAETTVTPAQLITPGKGIGQLAIGMPVDSALAKLGQPDSSDAAMGSALMAWYSKDASKHRTAVFSSMNMGNENFHRIKRIMVSSPWFKTEAGLGTGATLTEIEKNYQLNKVDNVSASQKGLLVFSDNSKGICFDIDSVSRKCVFITVFAAHESATSYIDMH